ncbi:hypothetical protein [Pseudomonas sp.]|uniref:hypothetical protein n=1 Tax=Pseudomonas sp. TaxID=306 RepID=UPI00290AC63E|nr:hypothetical protein [Pseudomonas sp.]MDU4255578.1 hypothetical protein [Pseudomonas sp.]
MKVRVQMVGVEQARRRLAEIGRSVEPDLRGGLNSAVRRGRKELYLPDLLRLFPSSRMLNRAMALKLAGTRRLNARIIPSSSGVRVRDRKGWQRGMGTTSGPTRSQIYVPDLTGRKLAAGFVNPEGRQKSPLATHSRRGGGSGRSYRYGRSEVPVDALGPSVAYYFRRLSNVQRVRLIGAIAQQEFERRVRMRLAKGR